MNFEQLQQRADGYTGNMLPRQVGWRALIAANKAAASLNIKAVQLAEQHQHTLSLMDRVCEEWELPMDKGCTFSVALGGDVQGRNYMAFVARHVRPSVDPFMVRFSCTDTSGDRRNLPQKENFKRHHFARVYLSEVAFRDGTYEWKGPGEYRANALFVAATQLELQESTSILLSGVASKGVEPTDVRMTASGD